MAGKGDSRRAGNAAKYRKEGSRIFGQPADKKNHVNKEKAKVGAKSGKG